MGASPVIGPIPSTFCVGARKSRAMLWAVLTSALRARSPAPRMAISASPPPTIAEYPSPALSPWDVVASQISALQAEDSAPTLRIPVATTLAPARTPRAHGVPCRGRCAHLPLRIARVQAHDGKDEAHVGASGAPVPAPSRPRRAPVAPPSRPRRAPVAPPSRPRGRRHAAINLAERSANTETRRASPLLCRRQRR